MKVAIIAESFLPQVNGVTNSVLRTVDYLIDHGNDALIIAPGAREFQEEVSHYRGVRIVRVPTIMVPPIDSLPVGLPTHEVYASLKEFAPDVVHLASPYVLGAAGSHAAHHLGIPAVAVYQTDVGGYTLRYHLRWLIGAHWKWTRTFHNWCARTLAPSSIAVESLEQHGVNNVYRWGRGVDTELFSPAKRSEELRRDWDPTGTKKIIGFVGRLAAEKGVQRLAALNERTDLQLVIVGDGPLRAELEQILPTAHFMGALYGEELARAHASFDVFVHPGEFETFCQTIQEAHASGVPTIAPRAGGPIDLVDDGRTGYLLPVEEFEQVLGENVDKLLDAGEGFKKACRESVENRTWDAICEELMGHYRAAMAANNRSLLSF